MCMSTSTRAHMLIADCHAEICIPVVSLGLWWKGEVGRTRHRYGIRYWYHSICNHCRTTAFFHSRFPFLPLSPPLLRRAAGLRGLRAMKWYSPPTPPPFPSPSSIPSSHRNSQQAKQAQKPPIVCSVIAFTYPQSTHRTAHESAIGAQVRYGKASKRPSRP